jgi:hypothetical protein
VRQFRAVFGTGRFGTMRKLVLRDWRQSFQRRFCTVTAGTFHRRRCGRSLTS